MQAKDFKVDQISTVVENPKTLSLEDLKNSGASSAVTYGIKEGNTIEFLENYDENTIVGRKIVNKNMSAIEIENAPCEILVAVLRNGDPDWYSLSDCRRTNHLSEGLDDFRKEMLQCNNDMERLNKLQGTTIKAGEKINYHRAVWETKDDGRRGLKVDSDNNPVPSERTYVTYKIEQVAKKPSKK